LASPEITRRKKHQESPMGCSSAMKTLLTVSTLAWEVLLNGIPAMAQSTLPLGVRRAVAVDEVFATPHQAYTYADAGGCERQEH
jgi:hypothetical protein